MKQSTRYWRLAYIVWKFLVERQDLKYEYNIYNNRKDSKVKRG